MARLVNESDITAFDDAVSEYIMKEKQTMRNFASDIAELGSILKKHKETWKSKQMWTQYCAAIGIHISAANAQIRFYEYCLDAAKKKLLEEKVNNWAKMTKFLAMSDSQKMLLLDKDFKDDISSKEFGEIADEIKEAEEGKPEIVEVTEKDETDLFRKFEDVTGSNPLLANPKAAAEALQKELGLTINSREKLEGLVYLMKAIELLSMEASLNPLEKTVLEQLLDGQKKEVSELTL